MKLAISLFIACFACTCAIAQDKDQAAKVKTARMVYKPKPRRSLTIYYPDGWKSTDKRPALMIFRCHIPVQREHFRKLGMVVIEPQLSRVNHGKLPGLSLEEIAKLPKPRNQVEDVKSAIRYVRANAEKLGIAPNRIVATGTSGGGDLALQGWLNKSFEDEQDNTSVSHRPDALVLYCPAFDGINIWYVKNEDLLKQTKEQAPAFLPHLGKFVENTDGKYAMPLDHRAKLIEQAAALGKEQGIADEEIQRFQKVLEMFNKSDWQFLHPVEDALKMSASRILTKEPLPPTLIMFGERDHLYQHQTAFVAHARQLGQEFDLKIFKNGAGHSFMMQPAFIEPSNREIEVFLTKHKYLPVASDE